MEREEQAEVRRPVRKLHFDCNLPGLLDEVLNNPTCAILKVPIDITKGILAELAHLAIELNDDRLHIMMLRLGLYDLSAEERVKKIDELREKVRKDLYERIGGKPGEIFKKDKFSPKKYYEGLLEDPVVQKNFKERHGYGLKGKGGKNA